MAYIVLIGVIIVTLVFWVNRTQKKLAEMAIKVDNAMSQIGVQISSQCEILGLILSLVEWYTGSRKKSIIKIMREGQIITKDSLPEDVLKQEKIISKVKNEIVKSEKHCTKLSRDDKYLKALDALQQYEKMIRTSMLIYNDSVNRMNREIRMFPTCLVAGILGFAKPKCFEEGR